MKFEIYVDTDVDKDGVNDFVDELYQVLDGVKTIHDSLIIGPLKEEFVECEDEMCPCHN